MQMNFKGSSPTFRYWKAVPTGMSIDTLGTRLVTLSSSPSRRQISPSPYKMCRNSLMVSWIVALLICPAGAVLWIMLPVVPFIMNRISAPAGDFASATDGSLVSFIIVPPRVFQYAFRRFPVNDSKILTASIGAHRSEGLLRGQFDQCCKIDEGRYPVGSS